MFASAYDLIYLKAVFTFFKINLLALNINKQVDILIFFKVHTFSFLSINDKILSEAKVTLDVLIFFLKFNFSKNFEYKATFLVF